MLKPVKTKKDYETALQRCYELIQKDVKANPKIAEAIIQLSRLKFGRPRELIEAEITQRARL